MIGARTWLKRLRSKRGSNIHTVPRRWSNAELKKFAPLFRGSVINVSAWKDEDKEGRRYKDYFSNASSYHLSNYDVDYRGLQGLDNEYPLDLQQPLDPSLVGRFDVVFNHTTLEHIYDFRAAFRNLCLLTNDVLILVVPFVQQMHTTMGDFWRFSPEAVNRLHGEHSMEVLYLSFNNHVRSSVYVFSVGSKRPERWKALRKPITFDEPNPHRSVNHPLAGCNAILPERRS